ncbi:hypothetical protein ACP70R_005496 [Stipagrostis hirtigluma subsp. patula]
MTPKRAAAVHSRRAERPSTPDGAPRRRRPCSTAAQTTSPPAWGAKRARTARGGGPRALWRDWAGLADGPAGLVAERVLAGDVADYVRFRAVCRAWRRCSADPRKHSALDARFHPRRWFMARETPHPNFPDRRLFMNVSTGQFVGMHLPELYGYCTFGPTAEGLLVLVDKLTLVVRLLNPFTQQLTELPTLATLLPPARSSYGHELADGDLSVCGAGLADEYTFALYVRKATMLAVARPGDRRWTVVDRGTLFVSALSFAGRFYCADEHGDITVVDTAGNQRPLRVAAVAELAARFSPMALAHRMHLVESDGELMLVHRILCRDDDGVGLGGYRRRYDVYRVDLDARKTVPVRALNGHAVFFGKYRALSVSSEAFPSVIADAVYPSIEFDEKFEREKIDAYRLVDGSIEPLVCSYVYDIQGAMKMARPYRIIDYLCSCVRGYADTSY